MGNRASAPRCRDRRDRRPGWTPCKVEPVRRKDRAPGRIGVEIGTRAGDRCLRVDRRRPRPEPGASATLAVSAISPTHAAAATTLRFQCLPSDSSSSRPCQVSRATATAIITITSASTIAATARPRPRWPRPASGSCGSTPRIGHAARSNVWANTPARRPTRSRRRPRPK